MKRTIKRMSNTNNDAKNNRRVYYNENGQYTVFDVGHNYFGGSGGTGYVNPHDPVLVGQSSRASLNSLLNNFTMPLSGVVFHQDPLDTPYTGASDGNNIIDAIMPVIESFNHPTGQVSIDITNRMMPLNTRVYNNINNVAGYTAYNGYNNDHIINVGNYGGIYEGLYNDDDQDIEDELLRAVMRDSMEVKLRKDNNAILTKYVEISPTCCAEEKCPICRDMCDLNSNVYKLSCSHIFHGKCIFESYKYNKKCPVCRSEI